MRYIKNVLVALGVSSLLFEASAFSPQRPRTATVSSLAMGYLDNLSPQEPNSGENDEYKPAPPVNVSPASNAGGGVVPSGRGPLGSYLDAVCSGQSGNDHDQQDDDESMDASSGEIEMEERVTSWTRKYLSNFLTDDDPRVDIRNLLTQRSIQSFMRLLEECRDPHSAKWIQKDFLKTGNLLDFHGSGAQFIEQFGGKWDAPLLEMIARPKDRIIISAKRRGRGHGGWSKNNPYLQERWVEIPVDIDPPNLATRILSVREQIAAEWLVDIDVLIEANDDILVSYFEQQKNQGLAPTSGSFVRTAADKVNNNSRYATTTSSPFRRSNFDLMYNLCTQAAIHRILRQMLANHEDQSTEFIFLRDFYTERAEQYFDGDLQYERADDFIDELLQTTPMVVGNTGASTQNLVDPVRAAEEIIQMRKIIAQDWKAMMSRVSEEHTGIRQALLTNTFSNDAPISSTFDDSTGFQ